MAEPRLRVGGIGSPEGVALEDETGAEVLRVSGGEVEVATRLLTGELHSALRGNGGTAFSARHKRFGAKGDLSADDTQAVQDILQAASEDPTGGPAYLDPTAPGLGYLVTSDIEWPAGVRLAGGGDRSRLVTDGCGLVANDVDWIQGADFTIRRTGTPGAAITLSGTNMGFRRSFFHNVGIVGSTGIGALLKGGWLFTWTNPYIRGCDIAGMVVEQGVYATGMNSVTLVGGEVQANPAAGIVLDLVKQFNLVGTAIEGNGVGLGIGRQVQSLNVLGYFEANTAGHIVGYSHNGGTAGQLRGGVIQGGSYFLRGSGSDTAIDLPNLRSLYIEDGVIFAGYANAASPVISVSDVGDSNRARGYLGEVEIDAPLSQVLDNNCRFFGKRETRNYYIGKTLPAAETTTIRVGIGGGGLEQTYPSTIMSVYLDVFSETEGVAVMAARARNNVGELVGAQVNRNPNLTQGYNRISFTLSSAPEIAYIEVVRMGTSANDTAADVEVSSVEVTTWENRVKHV